MKQKKPMIRHIIWDVLMKSLTLISPTLNTKIQYYKCFHRRLDLRNPQTSNEKVLWLKLNTYYKNPLVTQCADKYEVRKYVEAKGLKDILNPIIGVYDKPEEIDWSKLPQKFVLKSNYFCSYNIICTDKDMLDKDAAIKEMHKWFKSTGHLFASEMQYADIKRRIICEQYIETEDGDAPADYKIYCCNGKPTYIMVCIGRTKSQKPKFYYFNVNGELQREMTIDGLNAPTDFHYEKTIGWDNMLHAAEILSAPFPFVRADFYVEKGQVIFGELTFTPAMGLDTTKQVTTDNIIGSLIQLPKK